MKVFEQTISALLEYDHIVQAGDLNARQPN